MVWPSRDLCANSGTEVRRKKTSRVRIDGCSVPLRQHEKIPEMNANCPIRCGVSESFELRDKSENTLVGLHGSTGVASRENCNSPPNHLARRLDHPLLERYRMVS